MWVVLAFFGRSLLTKEYEVFRKKAVDKGNQRAILLIDEITETERLHLKKMKALKDSLLEEIIKIYS